MIRIRLIKVKKRLKLVEVKGQQRDGQVETRQNHRSLKVRRYWKCKRLVLT
jgi:hypothetical protein